MDDLYTELQKEFSLPDFELLDHDFEISEIEEEHFILRQIREKIDEKIEDITKIFEEILHPEKSFASFREANSFSDEERERMLELYQRFMIFHRKATELFIDDSEKKNADFINGFMKEWPELKKETIGFVSKLKDSWKKGITKKEVVGYLG